MFFYIGIVCNEKVRFKGHYYMFLIEKDLTPITFEANTRVIEVTSFKFNVKFDLRRHVGHLETSMASNGTQITVLGNINTDTKVIGALEHHKYTHCPIIVLSLASLKGHCPLVSPYRNDKESASSQQLYG